MSMSRFQNGVICSPQVSVLCVQETLRVSIADSKLCVVKSNGDIQTITVLKKLIISGPCLLPCLTVYFCEEGYQRRSCYCTVAQLPACLCPVCNNSSLIFFKSSRDSYQGPKKNQGTHGLEDGALWGVCSGLVLLVTYQPHDFQSISGWASVLLPTK